MTKAPWEGEKAPAATTPAPQPDPAPVTPTAPPPPPANVTETAPVAETPAVADEEALAAFTPSIDGPQAPLELINLVSNGMSVSEAKKHLGME